MKILAVSPVFPCPPEDGDRIRIYHFLEQLSKKHEIYLVSFYRKGGDRTAAELKKICKEIITVPITSGEIFLNALKAVFSGLPLTVAAYESEKMREAVDETITRVGPDLLYAYRLRTAPYVEGKNIPKVIDIVDSMALLNLRRAKFEKNPLRLVYGAMDTVRLLKYEKALEKKFSHIFINSEDDAAYLNIKNIVVAQNGSSGRKAKTVKNSIFTAGFFGNMEYPPNLDAALHFCKNVWKKLSDSDNNMKLVITGDRNGKLASTAGRTVEVKGYVADIDAEIGSWDVSLVPVRYGAGRQNKILKSWSCGIPVVASVFAAKGVYGRDGINMLIARNDTEFAAKIQELKNNTKLRFRIIAGGTATVKKYFDWKIPGKIIDAVMRKDAEKK
jgi:glycosyltransferase involved in cell wall biosynthesis